MFTDVNQIIITHILKVMISMYDRIGLKQINFGRSKEIKNEGGNLERQIYFWIEDRKTGASYQFWEKFLNQLFPMVHIESKGNSSELIKAIKSLDDSQNRYIIMLDNSFDNPQIAMERKKLEQYLKLHTNLVLLDIICFEYVLLEFKELIDWIYAVDDEFIVRRAKVITAREDLITCIATGDLNYKMLSGVVKYDDKVNEHNIEQLSAKLLFDLTRNTGFEVSKGTIGPCWIKSCCDWESRDVDDICGLDYRRITARDKMLRIYEGTCLKNQFSSAGLEVIQ